MAAICSMVKSFFSDDSVDEASLTKLIVSLQLVASSFLADDVVDAAVSLISSLATASSVELLGMLPSGERMSLRDDLLRKTMLKQFRDILFLFFLELVEMVSPARNVCLACF